MFDGAFYQVPPIENSGDLQSVRSSLLDESAADIWRLLDATFASIKTTDNAERHEVVKGIKTTGR